MFLITRWAYQRHQYLCHCQFSTLKIHLNYIDMRYIITEMFVFIAGWSLFWVISIARWSLCRVVLIANLYCVEFGLLSMMNMRFMDINIDTLWSIMAVLRWERVLPGVVHGCPTGLYFGIPRVSNLLRGTEKRMGHQRSALGPHGEVTFSIESRWFGKLN